MGRLTKEPEIRYTQTSIPVASFTLAVERKVAKGKEPESDFLPIVAWRNLAEFASKYLHKGQRIVVTGSIHTRSFTDKDDVRRYVTEIIAENFYFADAKKTDNGNKQADNNTGSTIPQSSNEYSEYSDEQEDLPF